MAAENADFDCDLTSGCQHNRGCAHELWGHAVKVCSVLEKLTILTLLHSYTHPLRFKQSAGNEVSVEVHLIACSVECDASFLIRRFEL